jgi:hypothetical protein
VREVHQGRLQGIFDITGRQTEMLDYQVEQSEPFFY